MNEEIFTLKMLYLDDIRYPQETANYMSPVELRPYYRQCQIDIVRNYNEFCEYLTHNEMPDIVSLDHDLSDEHYSQSMYESAEAYNKYAESFTEKTGYDCAKFLI